MIRTRRCAYQGERNVTFPENFTQMDHPIQVFDQRVFYSFLLDFSAENKTTNFS